MVCINYQPPTPFAPARLNLAAVSNSWFSFDLWKSSDPKQDRFVTDCLWGSIIQDVDARKPQRFDSSLTWKFPSYDGTISHDISLLWSDDSGTYKRKDEVRIKQIHILDVTYTITVLKLYKNRKNSQNILRGFVEVNDRLTLLRYFMLFSR